MIYISDVIKANKAETIAILKGLPNNTLRFAEWKEGEDGWKGHYAFKLYPMDETDTMDEETFCEQECPWIRVEGRDEIVVAIRLNSNKDEIQVMCVDSIYDQEDERDWFPIYECDGISEVYIYNKIVYIQDSVGF